LAAESRFISRVFVEYAFLSEQYLFLFCNIARNAHSVKNWNVELIKDGWCKGSLLLEEVVSKRTAADARPHRSTERTFPCLFSSFSDLFSVLTTDLTIKFNLKSLAEVNINHFIHSLIRKYLENLINVHDLFKRSLKFSDFLKIINQGRRDGCHVTTARRAHLRIPSGC
jgi:hypothetical protein